MGLFRYIVQGFGWEIGSHAAREGIAALDQQAQAQAQAREKDKQDSKRALAKVEKARAKEAARQRAEIERQLKSLKKHAGR